MTDPRGSRDSLALSNLLLCHESESSLNESEDPQHQHQHQLVPTITIGHEVVEEEDDDEFITELVRKENQKLQEPIKTTSSSSSFDRLIAIDWILTTRTRFGFQHQTAYIAISYFDLFLQKRFIGLQRDEIWAIKLLSVACLSIAAKMEERNVPGLSQYPQDQDFVLKPEVIRKTELMILSTLEWKMNIITPFHYFHYFITKHNHSVSRDLVLLRSSESLLALTKEISFTDYRQFVVAAATTLLASDVNLTKEEISEKFGSISWWSSIENDNVYSCYKRMLEIEERKHMTPPPEIGGVQHAVASGSGAKRRLSFDDPPDQKRMR